MWRILEADLRYHKSVFLIFLPFILAYSKGFLPAMVVTPWLMVNTVIPFRSKEKRERLLAILPVTLRQIAMARILLVMIPSLAWYLAFFLFWWTYSGIGMEEIRAAMVIWGLIVSGYSVAFAINDVFLFTRMAIKSIFAALLLLFLGLWVAYDFSNSSGAPALTTFLETLQASNPFAGLQGNILLLGVSLALAALSVLTFERRKTHTGCD